MASYPVAHANSMDDNFTRDLVFIHQPQVFTSIQWTIVMQEKHKASGEICWLWYLNFHFLFGILLKLCATLIPASSLRNKYID